MKLEKILDKLIEWGFYGLFFITPFLFNPSRTWLPSFELFEWNKMMFVYAVTVIIVTSWLAKMVLHRKVFFTRTFLDVPLMLFLFSQILSTFFSIDRHVSIFGYYSRFHGGLLSLITYILLFYALTSNIHLVKLKKMFSLALSSGVTVAIYGILEKFGIDTHMWVQDVQARVFSTLGQPNWLAAYLNVLLFLAMAGWYKVVSQTNKKENLEELINPKSVSQKINQPHLLLFIITVVFYICLLLTKSRSGFLAFWLSSTAFWGLMYRFYKQRRKTVVRSLIALNIIFLILNFVISTPFPQYNKWLTYQVFQPKPIAKKVKPDAFIPAVKTGPTDTTTIRKIVWKGAVEIIKNYPLFGSGVETFAFSYYKFRPPEHNLTSEWDFLYNRAHNEFLNIAATSGLVGLTTYLLLILAVFHQILKYLKLPDLKTKTKIVLIGLAAAYLSISVTNFFGFSVVMIGLFFFTLPAIVYALKLKQDPQPQPAYSSEKTVSKLQKILLVLLALLSIYLFTILGRFWIADSFYARALSFSDQEQYAEAYDLIKTASNLRPDEPIFHDQQGTIASELSTLALESGDSTTAALLAKDAISQSAIALSISPQNINFWKTRTKILFELGLYDPEFTTQALDSILIALSLAPTDPKIAYNAAVLYGRTDDNQKAIELLQHAIGLKPDYRDAYIALSIFYQQEGEIEKARQALEQVLTLINPDDQEVKDRIELLQ